MPALYLALTGKRCGVNSADTFAARDRLRRAPLDDLLVSHVVVGKNVCRMCRSTPSPIWLCAGSVRRADLSATP